MAQRAREIGDYETSIDSISKEKAEEMIKYADFLPIQIFFFEVRRYKTY